MSLSVYAAAKDAPDVVAVAGAAECTFAALAREVDRWLASLDTTAVHALVRRDAGEGRLVAVVPQLDMASLVTLHACIAIHAPMLMVHPRSTPSERAAILRASGASWLWERGKLVRLEPTTPASPPEGTLAVVPTSGTTGAPKLAVLSRAAFEASARASEVNLGWQFGDRWLLGMPLAHVGGLSVLTRCLLARRGVVVPASGGFRVEELPAMARHGTTLMSVVPTMLYRLLEAGAAPPERLRAVLVGGAAAPQRLLERARRRGWPVLATYGLTEACSQVATQRLGENAAVGVGPALPGFEVRIVDGEVHVRGPAMMDGYLGRSSPFVDDGWFPTGDQGFLDSVGNLRVRGRRGDLIVTGGENVYPEEVEAELLACPGVDAVCVVGVDDDEWGQVAVAAVVGDVDLKALGRHCRQRLAPHRRPKRMFRLDALPTLPSGKADRSAVRVLALREPSSLPRFVSRPRRAAGTSDRR